MIKRSFGILFALALVASVFSVGPAKAQGAASEAKFFLSSTGCSAADTNFDYLTITDAEDEIECFYTGAGARSDIGEAVGNTPATSDRETATRRWDTIDGVPLTLDASRPVTGEIYTNGGACVLGGVPCAPAGISAGQVIIEIALVGTTGGKEVELGTQTDEFQRAPGGPHLTELSIQPDASLSGTVFETIELQTWIHGASVGHGVIKTTGDANSFISVPKAAGTTVKEAPGKGNPPGKGKKKGCPKGKGKKKGACAGNKPGKPSKPKAPVAPSCPALTPAEVGKDAETSVVTDTATAEAPVEVELTAAAGGPNLDPAPVDERSFVYQNVQVDTANAETGLYVKATFPDRHDYDLYLYNPDGTEADHSGDTQIADEDTVFGCGSGACEAGTNYESINGLITSDCGGYTIEVAGFATTGGAVTLSLWLGEGAVAPGGGQESAFDSFWGLMGLGR